MFASAESAEEFSLQWCVGENIAICTTLAAHCYATWLRVAMCFDWTARRISIKLNGHSVGEIPFRMPACEKAGHITLLNVGGPATASWSEVILA